MRGPLLPATVPGWRSRAELFDMAVLEAYEPIERRWQDRVSTLDIAGDRARLVAAGAPPVEGELETVSAGFVRDLAENLPDA